MNRGRYGGKRGQVPMRVRRRQSDAKWRASVASCYETLKMIIPNGKVLPKRKASKALILQETERHIEELERGIARILNIEAPDHHQGVLWRNGDHWYPAILDNFQKDFSQKQSLIFHQSNQGKRCYNLLHDIQEEILSVSVDPESLAFVPIVPAGGTHTTKDVATCTNKRYRTSKARCRYETERACQKILSHFKSSEIVEAVIPTARKRQFHIDDCVPSEPLQAVPSLGLNPPPAAVATVEEADRTVTLKKTDNKFVAVDSRVLRMDKHPSLSEAIRLQPRPAETQHAVQNFQEVPATPNKVYGITGDDVMISQQCGDPDGFSSVLPGYSTPMESSASIKRDISDVPCSPTLSTVCKQLDFATSVPEILFVGYDHENDYHLASDPCISTATSTGFAPFTTISSFAASGTSPSVGFTPVKLPSDPYMSESQLFSPNSAWALGATMDARVPQASLSDLEDLDMEENRSLLCMENFDLDDTTDGQNTQRTPQKQDMPVPVRKIFHKQAVCKRKSCCWSTDDASQQMPERPQPKCRKRLEGLYDKKSTFEKDLPSIVPLITGIFDANSQFSDFDGYLFYYRQVAPDIRKKLGGSPDANSVAAIVSDMWQHLPSDDRHTLVTLAALENQDSNSSENGSLSRDLEELDVKPLSGEFQDNVVT